MNDTIFNPNTRDPDFPCTAEANVSNLTQTLEVQHLCIAVKSVKASVSYYGRYYFAQNHFTVNGNIIQFNLSIVFYNGQWKQLYQVQ